MGAGSTQADDSLVGSLLDGRYKIMRILGVGGMGAVYQAQHELLGTTVAVKIMRSSQPQAAERFLAEARRTFRLDHPNCVRVTDAGVAPGELLYLVMEMLEGRTLGEELENDGTLSPSRAAHIGAQVAEAISCAHDLGYVHRDLKPDNIMLVHKDGDPDFTKVLDFGLAKLTHAAKLDGKHSVMSFTQNGMVFGTPHYMSPEQAQGHELGPPSDIYSLGVVLYEAIAGMPPFDSESEVEILISHVQKTPTPLSAHRKINPELDALIMSMLLKKPSARPGSAMDLARGLAAEARRASSGVAAAETLILGHEVSAEFPAPTIRSSAERPTVGITPEHMRRLELGDETRAMLAPRRGPFLLIAALVLAAAGALTIWALTRPTPGAARDVADASATAVTVSADASLPLAADAGAVASTTPDAAPSAPDAAVRVPVALTARQKKAIALYKKAVAAKRSGKGVLTYLPLLDAAYRQDRKNRDVRRMFVRALLASTDPASRARGCRMIRKSSKRYKKERCGQ